MIEIMDKNIPNDFSPDNIPRSQDASMELTSASLTSLEPSTHKPHQQQLPPYDNESQVLSEVLQAAIARDVPKVMRLAASLGISKSGSSSLAAVVSSSGDLPDSTTTSKESATESTPVDFPTADYDEHFLKPSKPSSITVATKIRISSASTSPEVTQSNIIADINQVDLDDSHGLPEYSNPATFVEVGDGSAPGEGLVTSDISDKPVVAAQLSECQSASISSTCQDRSAIAKTIKPAEQQQQTCALSQASAIPPDGVLKSSDAPLPASLNQPEVVSDRPSTGTSVLVTLGNSSSLSTPATFPGHPLPLPPPTTAHSSLPEVLSLSLTPVSPQGDFMPVRVSLPDGLPDVVMQVLPQPGTRMGESYTIDVPSHLILSGISSALASGTAAVNSNNKETPVMLYISPASGTAASTTTTTTMTATPPLPVAGSHLGAGLPAVSSQLRPASVITTSSNINGSSNNKKMRAIAPKPSSQQSACLSVSTSARASSGLGKSSHKRQSASTSTSVSASVCLAVTATTSALATVNCPTAATPFLFNNSAAGAGRQQQSASLSPVRSGRGRRRTAVSSSSNSNASNSSVISNGSVHLSTFPCGLPPNVLLSDVNAAAGAMLQPPHLLAPVTCHAPAMVINNMQHTTTIMSNQPGIFAPHEMNSRSVFHPAPAIPFLFSGSGGGAPLIGAATGPSHAATYMFQQPPFHLPASGVGGSISTPSVYAPTPSSCGLPPHPTTTSVAVMQAGGLSSSTVVESSLFPSAAAAPLCPSSGRGILSARYANQSGACLPMSGHHQYSQPTTADSSSPFGISLVCSQAAGQGAVGLLLPHDTNDTSCLSQSNSLVYSLSPGQQPMFAAGQQQLSQQPVLTAVSSSTHFFSTSSSAYSFSAPISSELMTSLHPPALSSSVNGMLSLPPAALIPTPNSMVFSTGRGGLFSQQPLLALQPSESSLSTFDDTPLPGGGGAIDGNQIGDNMDQDDLLTLAWRLTQEDFDTTGHHSHHQQQSLLLVEANSLPSSVDSCLGIYANAVSSSPHGVVAAALPTEFVDCDQLYAGHQQQQPQHEAESDEVVLLDYSVTPPPALASTAGVVVDCQTPTEIANQQSTATSESTGNADIDALLAAAAQIGAASGVGDAQSSVAVVVPVSSSCSVFSARAENQPPMVTSGSLSVTSVLTTFSASETVVSAKPVDSVSFEIASEDQAKSPTSTLEQAADDLFAEFPPSGGDDVNFTVANHSGHILDPAERGAVEGSFDGTDEPTSLAAVLGCNAEDAADLESVLGPEVSEVGESGAASHSFLNSLVCDEAAGGVVDRHIFDEDFTVCGGDGNVLDKCFETPSADIDCRRRESDVPLHDENTYSSTSCGTHYAVSTMPFPTPSSKQVRSLLRNTLPAPMSFHFDELSGNGRRPAVGRAEAGTVSDPTEYVDAVFLGVDFSDDVGEYTTAEQFQEALMLLGPQPNSPNFDLGEGSAKSNDVNNIFSSVSAITADLATAFDGDENLRASIDDNDDNDTTDAAGVFADIQSPSNQDDDNNGDVPVDSRWRQDTSVPTSPLLMETPASCLSEQMKVVNPETNVSGETSTSPVDSVCGKYSPNKSRDTILTGLVSPTHYDDETVEPAAEVMNFTKSDLNINTLIDSLPGAASPLPLLWSLVNNSKTNNPPRSYSLPNLHLSSSISGGETRQRCSSAPPSLLTGVPRGFFTSSPLSEDVDQVAEGNLSPVPDTDDSLLLLHNLSSEMVQPNETNLPAAPTATSSIISVLASSSALVEAAVMYSADNAALDSDDSPVKSNLESLDKLDRILESCQRRSQQNDSQQLLLLTDSSKPSSSTDSDSKNVTTASREEESLVASPSCLTSSSAVESGESQRSPNDDKAVTFSPGEPADSQVVIARPIRTAVKSRRPLVTTHRPSRLDHVSPVVARHSSASIETTDDSTEPGLSSDASLPTTSSSAASASRSDVDCSSANGVVDKALATFGIGSKRPLSFGLSMDSVDRSKSPNLVLIGNFTQHLPQLTLSVNGSLFLGAVDPFLLRDDVGSEADFHPTVASSPEGDDEAVANTRPVEQVAPRCRLSKRMTKQRVAKGIRRARRAGEESVVVPASQASQPFARFADSNCTLPSFASILTSTVTPGTCPLSSQVTSSSANSWLPASRREAMLFGTVGAESPSSDCVSNNNTGTTSVITSESSATMHISVALQSSPAGDTSDDSVSAVGTTRKSSPPPKLATDRGGDRFEPAVTVAVVDTPSSTSSTGSFTSLMNTSLRQPLSFVKEDTTSPFGKHPLLTNPILSTSTTVAGVTFGSFAGAAAFRATSFSALAAKAAAMTTSGFQELKNLTFSDLAKKTNTSTSKSWTSPPLSSSSVSSQQHQQWATSTPPFPVLTFSPLPGVTPRQLSEPSGSSSLQPIPPFQNAGIKPVGTSIGIIGCPNKRSPPSSLPQCSPAHTVHEVRPLSLSPQPPTNQSGESAAPKLLIRLRGCNSAFKSRRRGRRKFPRVSRLKLRVKKVVANSSAEPEVSQSPAPPADDTMAEDHYYCSKLGTPLHQLSPTTADMGVQLHYSPSLTPIDDLRDPVNTNVVVAVFNSSSSVSEHLPNGTPLTPLGDNNTTAAEPIDDTVDESSFQDCVANNFVLDVCSYDDAAPTDGIVQDKRSPELPHSPNSENIKGVCTSSPSVVELPHDAGVCVAREAAEPREPLRLRLNLKLAGLQRNYEHKSKVSRPRTRPAEDGSGSVCPKKRRKKHKQKPIEQSADTQLYPSAVSESGDPEQYPTALPQQQPSVDASVSSFEHSCLGQKQVVIPPQGHNRGRHRNSRTCKLASRARGVAAVVCPSASTNLLHATGPATGATSDLMGPSSAGCGRSSLSSGAFSRKIFSTAKQERRSSCALLVARPWRPMSVISPRKRGMISSCSTPVSGKANKLTVMRMPSSASSVARKQCRSKANRRVHKESGLFSTKQLDSCQPAADLQARSQTPIRLVIRLGQQKPPPITMAPTDKLGMMTAVRCGQSTVEAKGSPVSVASGSADPPSEDEVERAELFQFCIATEAETYVDVNQAQIHRTANSALLAHLSGVTGGYQMQPLVNDSKTGLANSKEAGSVNITVFGPPCPVELGKDDPPRGRQKTSRQTAHHRRHRHRESASRRTEDDVVVDVVSVGGNELTSSATKVEHLRHLATAYDDELRRAAPLASDHPLRVQRHNGYLRYPLADSRSDRFLWGLDGDAKGSLGSISTLDSRSTPAAAADGCSGQSERPGSASATQQQQQQRQLENDTDDPYHHLTPHLFVKGRQELPHQQHCRPADTDKNNNGSPASGFMPDRLRTAMAPAAVASSVADNINQIPGFPWSSFSQPQAMEPVFPPEPSCATWPPVATDRRPGDHQNHLQPQQAEESLSSFSSQPTGSHQQQQQQQQQTLAMVYANAALRARNSLDLHHHHHQQQQDRMKAQWTSSLFNGSSGSAWLPPNASAAPPASHLPSLWEDFSYQQQQQLAAGDQQQSKLASTLNFFLDYRRPDAPSEVTTDFHSHQHGTPAAAVTVAQSPFSAVGSCPQAHSTGSESAVAAARLTAEFAPALLRVQQRQQKQQSEPRVSGW